MFALAQHRAGTVIPTCRFQAATSVLYQPRQHAPRTAKDSGVRVAVVGLPEVVDGPLPDDRGRCQTFDECTGEPADRLPCRFAVRRGACREARSIAAALRREGARPPSG